MTHAWYGLRAPKFDSAPEKLGDTSAPRGNNCHITTNRSKPIVFLVTHVRLQMELYNSAHGRFTILLVYVASLRRARPHLPALWIFQIMRYTIHGLSRQGPPIGQRGKLDLEDVSLKFTAFMLKKLPLKLQNVYLVYQIWHMCARSTFIFRKKWIVEHAFTHRFLFVYICICHFEVKCMYFGKTRLM